VDRVAELGSLESYAPKQDGQTANVALKRSSQGRGGGLMEALMETLVGRRANKDEGLMPFSAPTYAQVCRAFGDLVRAVYRLEVVGADRLPVTGPAVVAPNHDSVLDGIVLGACPSIQKYAHFTGI
jgi:hypothetical protein